MSSEPDKGRKRDAIKSKWNKITGRRPNSSPAVASSVKKEVSKPLVPSPSRSGGKLIDTFERDWAKVDIYAPGGEGGYPDCRISLLRNPPNDEDLREVLDAVDKFMKSELAAKGFVTSYDAVNYSGMPRMSLVWAVANWSAEPERRELLEERAVEARAAISSGYMFKFAKMALAAVFRVIPPACRTTLTTDFEDPDAQRIVWEAPNPKGAAARALGLPSRGNVMEGEQSAAEPLVAKASSDAVVGSSASPGCLAFCGGGLLNLCGGKSKRALQDKVRKLEKRQKELTGRVEALEKSVEDLKQQQQHQP